jgi:peptide/nickel transport system permease protein
MNLTEYVIFIAKRLLVMVALLVVISMAVFALLYITPGDVAQILLGDQQVTPQSIAAIHRQYHLDDPLAVQYLRWASAAVHFDFGRSIRTGEPVLGGIERRLQLTLFLAAYGFLIGMGLGVGLGILAAIRKGRSLDRGIVGLSVLAVSSPAFVTGIILLYVLGVVIPVFPVFGQGEDFVDQLWHLTLPAIALALTGMARVIKLTRAAMITTLEQDYVAFARARGLSSARVLTAYAIRNSLNPIVTAGGFIFNQMMFGTVLVEVTFALPGVGNLLVDSISFKDIPMVQALGVLIALVVILVNLVIDVLYVAIDPRVRFSSVAA